MSATIYHINQIISNTNALELDFTGGLRLPIGNNQTRTDQVGSVRFNNELNLFEGRNLNSWLPIGSFVTDSDGNTTIVAESSPGANDNKLAFTTDSVLRLIIDENGNYFFTPTYTGNTISSANMHIDAINNRVGINTLTPTRELDVNGTVKATLFEGEINGGTF
jgi:hypothetical protein